MAQESRALYTSVALRFTGGGGDESPLGQARHLLEHVVVNRMDGKKILLGLSGEIFGRTQRSNVDVFINLENSVGYEQLSQILNVGYLAPVMDYELVLAKSQIQAEYKQRVIKSSLFGFDSNPNFNINAEVNKYIAEESGSGEYKVPPLADIEKVSVSMLSKMLGEWRTKDLRAIAVSGNPSDGILTALCNFSKSIGNGSFETGEKLDDGNDVNNLLRFKLGGDVATVVLLFPRGALTSSTSIQYAERFKEKLKEEYASNGLDYYDAVTTIVGGDVGVLKFDIRVTRYSAFFGNERTAIEAATSKFVNSFEPVNVKSGIDIFTYRPDTESKALLSFGPYDESLKPQVRARIYFNNSPLQLLFVPFVIFVAFIALRKGFS